MVYNWDGKEAECYRLYVQEKKALDEVIEYWEQRGFTPSKRAFQTQFKRWDFPSKQNPAHKNPVLTARVKELWEKNYTQKDMLDTLQVEGFQINDRELMRVRLRFNWFLRERRGKSEKRSEKNSQKTAFANSIMNQSVNTIPQETSTSKEDESVDAEKAQELVEAEEALAQITHEAHPEPLSSAETLRRKLRQQQLQVESDEKWRTRKRRRRTKGWAGLPADLGEPPRFPSETTIDESKAYLDLDNKQYKEMREQFQAICEEQGVMRKTVAGPEKWAQLLQRMITENAHLTNVFQQESVSLQEGDATWNQKNSKALALDVICQDVTKRMRTMDARMSIPEAKNTLGLNPEQTRQLRSAFLAILRADHVTARLQVENQRWNELKQQWVQESELLSQVLTGSETDPKHAHKLKAVEMLARDVMKRLRSEHSQKQPHHGPGPGPAPPTVNPHRSSPHNKAKDGHSTIGALPSNSSNIPAISAGTDFEIDPSLLLAASDAADGPLLAQAQNQHRPHVPASGLYSAQLGAPFLQSSSAPLPIFFRLHPHSTTPLPSKTVWLSVLSTSTLVEVKSLIMREHPGTIVVRLEGLIVHRVEGLEKEIAIAIDNDEELNAFLGHVGGGKATFVVLLSTGTGTATYG